MLSHRHVSKVCYVCMYVVGLLRSHHHYLCFNGINRYVYYVCMYVDAMSARA